MDNKRQNKTNGSLKAPKGSKGSKGQKAMNGTNGMNGMNGMNSMNGMNGMNGHAVSLVPRKNTPLKRQKQRGFFSRSFNFIARLLTWYSIYTILFRCPATLDECNESTPKICKPYFHASHAVAPHVTPYYNTYAAPYVDLARPYYDTLDRAVIKPSRSYAVKYGGPRVAQAQAFGHNQWEKNVQPQIVKYQTLAKAQYDQTVSPHVNKAAAVVSPYYDIARTNALQTYHEIIVPAYDFVHPYASHGYDVAYGFTKNTAVPSTIWAWNKTYTFLDSAIWPHVRDVYVLKVEPQLVRIGERLGRYKEKNPKPAVEEVETAVSRSTFVKPSTSFVSTTMAATMSTTPTATEEPIKTASHVPDVDVSPSPEASLDTPPRNSETPRSKEEIRALAAKTVAEDLELWQGKFTKVAEEGASDIEDRVDEISTRMIGSHANTTGKSLVAQLETTVRTELESLKKTILDVLESNKHDSEKRDKKLASAIRGAGLKIKNKAQNIREWRQSYEQETEIAVTKAAEEHFRILEQTRDLALQKIGMKWAWMDGVTYKDWQKYHQLRDRLDEWTEDLKRLITTHPGIAAAQTAGLEVEGEGMAIAQDAAEELVRLKQVAAWKATAEDLTDDFDSSTMQLAAEAAEKRMADAAEAARLAADAVFDKIKTGAEAASESLGEAVSSATSWVADAQETETVTVSLSQQDQEQVDFDTSALPPMESLATEPTDSATDLNSKLPSSSDGKSTAESTNVAEPIEPLPTSDPIDGPEQMEETILESPDLPIHSIDESRPVTTIKSAMFGAAAESVPTRQPILDDDILSSASSVLSVAQSDAPASITSAAQAAYTAAIAGAADQYSRAMSAVSVQISGEPKPAHEEMFSSVSNGYFSAMAAANSRLNEAMTAASASLYGTPTTTKWMPAMPTMPAVPSVDWERVQSIAQQNLQDSVNWASEQYESAKIAIGAAEPTPSTYLEGAEKRAEKLLDQAKHNYFAGIGIAHARYSEFLSAASTAVSSLTATPTPTNIQESASSVASVASESASSAASVAAEVAGSVASAASGSASSAASVAGEVAGSVASAASESASAAVSVASEAAESVASSLGDVAGDAKDTANETWDALVSRVSSQIYGAPTPTPWYENLYVAAGGYASQAGDLAVAATDAAAGQMTAAASLADEYAASASSAASSQYVAVSSLVSELIAGKEPTYTESVYSRLAHAYTAGLSSASSLASAASATAVSAASEVSDAASSGMDAAGESIASATDKVKETVEYLKDEL